MEKMDYDNPLRRQCLSIPDLCEAQLEGALKGLHEGISEAVLRRVRNVTLTGCGDSYFAARAAIPALKKYNNAFAATLNYKRCIDVARFIDFPLKYGESTMIAGISASGSAARLKEVMLRANQYGYESLLITNNPKSGSAMAAKSTLKLYTPEFPDSSPGLRNYYASLVGAYLFAAKLGQIKGICPPDSLQTLCDAVKSYTASVAETLCDMDDAMFALAGEWSGIEAFETIGDDICFSTAQFIAAKFVETSGILCSSNDAEDWCHTNYFCSKPEKRAVIVVADVNSNDRSRIGETVNQAAGVGRPVMLISNGDAGDFDIRCKISQWRIPSPPKGYEFLLALMNYLPGALLASYISAFRKEPYFRGEGFADESVMSIKSSEVVIV